MESSITNHYKYRALCILVAVVVMLTTVFATSGMTAQAASNDDVSGRDVVKYAKQFTGNPYVRGGNSLTRGTDCSGFVKLIYKKYGKSLPRTSSAFRSVGKSVSYSEAEAGDIICYTGHVAIYAGRGKIVHAANPRKGICVGPATYTTILSVRRVV